MKRNKNQKENENSVAVFCIDISGSMDATTTIPTGHELVKIKVKNDAAKTIFLIKF